ncbi:hypothetical protein OUZ56_018850 [Daphnia magna]|uniref:Uncharacterized protein n=1 Tax=Daphnia magna TaxID=35525 RepID=A0ABQ9Z9X2_9CRUS|nr:hypothetical protein OUZ56_018850 [Daphnia magna]
MAWLLFELLPEDEKLKFFIVETQELDIAVGSSSFEENREVRSTVSHTWLALDKKTLLYPPATCKVANKSPVDWGERPYRRFTYPEEGWLEYNVTFIYNEQKPRKYSSKLNKELQALKALLKNRPFLNYLDSDANASLGRGQRDKVPSKRKEDQIEDFDDSSLLKKKKKSS